MSSLGRHVLAEFTGCPAERLSDLEGVRKAMLQAAEASGAHVVTESFHHFSPLGISGVVIVSESHLAIHTWPEHGFAAVDYFTCGDSVKTSLALDVLKASLGAQGLQAMQCSRGPLSCVDLERS